MKVGLKFATELRSSCHALDISSHGSGRAEWRLERLSISQNSPILAPLSARLCPAEVSSSNAFNTCDDILSEQSI